MQLPDPNLNLQIQDGVAIHGGSRIHAATTTRITAEQAAAAIRDAGIMAAQEAHRAALIAPQLARESSVETANIAFAEVTAQAMSTRETAIAASNEVFENDPVVVSARNSREAAIQTANLILVAAIREQVIADANKAFDAATKVPRTARQEAIQGADAIFNAVTKEARTILDGAIASADGTYNEAEAAERTIYNAAEETANNIYKTAVDAAKVEFDNTVSVPRPIAATVGLMVAMDSSKALTTVIKGDEQTPVNVAINADTEKPFNTTIRGDEKNPMKIDLSLSKLPKGKLKINGIDIGFYLFSWRIFSIKVNGRAEIDNNED